MIVKVEPALVRDLGHLVMLECKALDYPLEQDEIKTFLLEEDKKAYVASISNRKVGMALTFRRDNTTIIARVSTHPDFRNMGVGKELMLNIEKDAWKEQHRLLRIYVPSYKIDDPLDPDYIGGWLTKCFFRANGCDTNAFFRYGRLWDAYKFERLL
jgi:GNAT superfamily N-acetyltransferase